VYEPDDDGDDGADDGDGDGVEGGADGSGGAGSVREDPALPDPVSGAMSDTTAGGAGTGEGNGAGSESVVAGMAGAEAAVGRVSDTGGVAIGSSRRGV